MDSKYVLFIPMGGINDCFCNISNLISYCKIHKRTLLLDFTNSAYNINFSDFFKINIISKISRRNKVPCCPIIYNSNEIKNIILSLENSNSLTVYPNNLDFNIIDLFDKTKKISFNKDTNNIFNYKCNNILLQLPSNDVDEKVILFSCCGGGNGYTFFKDTLLCENIKNIINKKIALLKKNYLCIHVRNTDIKCNYKKLYMEHKDIIDNFEQVYICTDDKVAYEYFKSKISNILCFTTFPEKSYKNLHYSDILPSTKMEDLLTDIFICTNSKSILSNSEGGFINLLRKCHDKKVNILNMLS